jgi:transposase
VHEELKRRDATLMILWEEYRAAHVDGHECSRFCALYGDCRKRLAPTMRQTHMAGDKLFVDWAGDTVPRRTNAEMVAQPGDSQPRRHTARAHRGWAWRL